MTQASSRIEVAAEDLSPETRAILESGEYITDAALAEIRAKASPLEGREGWWLDHDGNSHYSSRTPYAVISVEQDRRSEWSRHATLELAQRAARRYRRANRDQQHWVDHYGYEITLRGQVIDVIR